MNAIGRPSWTPWPMTQSIVWFIGGDDSQRTGSTPGTSSASISFTLWLFALILSSPLQFGSKTLTSTLGSLANWMASSRLIVDKSPSVDDLHSLLSKVTFSVLFPWSSCDVEATPAIVESYNNKTRMVSTISFATIINHNNGCPLNILLTCIYMQIETNLNQENIKFLLRSSPSLSLITTITVTRKVKIIL